MRKMKAKSILILLGMYINIFPQSYDVNYTIEYALKDARGTVLSKMKLFRNGNNLKFSSTFNAGKPDENTTDIYIFKDERMINTIVSNSIGKFGGRRVLDMMYVFMQTGVYIFDLGNDTTIFNIRSRAGNMTVLGMECVKYTIVSGGDASSDYYMYQDNLMLKRWVGSAAEGNSIEALTFDNTTPVPESMFLVPADVTYY